MISNNEFSIWQYVWNRIPIVLLICFIICLPLEPVFANITLICIVLVWLMKGGYTSVTKSIQDPILKFIILYLFTLLISLLYSTNIAGGLNLIIRKLPIIIIPLVLPFFIGQVQFKLLSKVYLATWFIASMFSLVSTYLIYGLDLTNVAYFSWVLPNTLNLDSNYYALFISISVFLLLHNSSVENSFRKKTIYWFAIAYFIGFIALLSSRTTFFTTALAILIYPLFIHQKDRKNVRRVIGLIFLFTALLILVFYFTPYLREKTFLLLTQVDARYYEFLAGWNVFLQSPLIGVGIGDSQVHLLQFYKELGFQEGIDNEYNVHNEYLHTAISAGLVSLFAFIGIIYSCAKRAIAKGNFLQIVFVLIFFIGCFTEVLLNRFKGIIFFSFFLTLLFIYPYNEKNTAR